jgi:hypothetical protein
MYSILAICFVASIIFVYNNYSFYDRPMAKVINTELEDTTKVTLSPIEYKLKHLKKVI